MRLLVFGRGYSASRFLRTHGEMFSAITATTRGNRQPEVIPGVKDVIFDGFEALDPVRVALATATTILVSIPPGPAGDPVLNVFGDLVAKSKFLRSIVYLSTIGVYGDHAGAWVDETTTPNPRSDRSMERLAAEQGWQKVANNAGIPLHILRLAGIYGPGQNALENLRSGTARRIVKLGQVFNRIHVDDIASAIAATIFHTSGGIWNVGDNEPAPPQDVIASAAGLLGIEPPEALAFETAALTPMARSFYSENKRVSNTKLLKLLGKPLQFPTYREGLTALAQTIASR